MGSIFEMLSLVGVGLGGLVPVIIEAFRNWSRQDAATRAIENIEAKAEKEPDKISYAWDAARRKLEGYFDSNLSQVNAIFWVAVSVMGVGFTLIGWAVWRSFLDPKALPASYVAAGSGILTEFMAVTFMLIYRSTLSQANSYTAILERINAVGMAVQIAETIDEADHALRNETRPTVVKLLLNANPRTNGQAARPDRQSRRRRGIRGS